MNYDQTLNPPEPRENTAQAEWNNELGQLIDSYVDVYPDYTKQLNKLYFDNLNNPIKTIASIEQEVLNVVQPNE